MKIKNLTRFHISLERDLGEVKLKITNYSSNMYFGILLSSIFKRSAELTNTSSKTLPRKIVVVFTRSRKLFIARQAWGRMWKPKIIFKN